MLREALLALVRDLADESLVPRGADEPKLADFVHWSDLIINGLTRSKNLKDSRPSLKRAAKDAWQWASSLAHKTSADGTLAGLCANQVRQVFGQWASLMRDAREAGFPRRVWETIVIPGSRFWADASPYAGIDRSDLTAEVPGQPGTRRVAEPRAEAAFEIAAAVVRCNQGQEELAWKAVP
jgi:hypothetical protein